MHEQVSAQAQAARARVAAAQARIGELTARRGTAGEDNLRLRQARNALAQARLQLQYSSVRADRAGTLSNLQLTPGTYVPAGTPVALVDDRIDIVADFREKSLRYVRPGDRAAVVFDARPGEVFGARVAAIDAGVRRASWTPTATSPRRSPPTAGSATLSASACTWCSTNFPKACCPPEPRPPCSCIPATA